MYLRETINMQLMKKFRLGIIVLIVFLTLLTTVFVSYQIYQKWGRQIIYASDNLQTLYPSSGKITNTFNESLFVVPSGVGRPFFDKVENSSLYPSDFYTVYNIPTQEQLSYSVGIFEKWEDIEETSDKYLILRDPGTKVTEKYRVSFENSDLFKDAITLLSIEKVTPEILATESKNPIDSPEIPQFTRLGFDQAKEFFKKGDALVLIPVSEPPELSKKDSAGNLLVSRVIIRRANDKF